MSLGVHGDTPADLMSWRSLSTASHALRLALGHSPHWNSCGSEVANLICASAQLADEVVFVVEGDLADRMRSGPV
eukprot:8348082-Pyramimonas_sp.AAC.1